MGVQPLRILAAAGDRPAAVAAPGVVRVRGGRASVAAETVAAEQPVAIAYGEETHVVMMATPADLEDLAVGFSLAEGVVGGIDEIAGILVADLDVGLRVALAVPPARAAALADRHRNLPGRSGCGLCGIASIEAALRPLPTVPPGPRVAAAIPSPAVRKSGGPQPMHRHPIDPTAGASFDCSFRFAALRAQDEERSIFLKSKEKPHPERAAQRAVEGRWSGRTTP
jgi:hypothetical protein